MPVTHERESGTECIVAVQQPAEIIGRPPQRRPLRRREQLGIFWMSSSMQTSVGHTLTVLEDSTLPNARSRLFPR